MGLFRNLTLTQIYTGNYLDSYLHQGLTQMWSLAVEAAFYVVLPLLAYLLLVWVCKRRWQPVRMLVALGALMLITPAWIAFVHAATSVPNGRGYGCPPIWLGFSPA